MKSRKRNKVIEFFRPRLWKVLLSIISIVISYFYFGPREQALFGEEEFRISLYAPLGIKNPFVFILVSSIFFYSFFLFVGWMIQMVKKKIKQ